MSDESKHVSDLQENELGSLHDMESLSHVSGNQASSSSLAEEFLRLSKREVPLNTIHGSLTSLKEFCKFYVIQNNILDVKDLDSEEQEYKVSTRAAPLAHISFLN